jgi:hypothetical protein
MDRPETVDCGLGNVPILLGEVGAARVTVAAWRDFYWQSVWFW